MRTEHTLDGKLIHALMSPPIRVLISPPRDGSLDRDEHIERLSEDSLGEFESEADDTTEWMTRSDASRYSVKRLQVAFEAESRISARLYSLVEQHLLRNLVFICVLIALFTVFLPFDRVDTLQKLALTVSAYLGALLAAAHQFLALRMVWTHRNRNK
ncbi:hypothetical protein [Frondihabitans sp. Leaf304]|uniref:hypothetical protein n=1 Tax=Frondihabitans sp. Leaf304 TaxID=1736329 RepID=UPI00138ED810|nr:hypothetical protein [Frondihabitans sp. Leaf304]